MNYMNNMMQGNNFNYGTNIGQGTYYTNTKPALMTQPLTNEEKDLLKRNKSIFDLKLEPLEVLASKCTHKSNGRFTLDDDPMGSGKSTCSICGETFTLLTSNDDIYAITEKVIDALQSVKTYYLDLPEETTSEYFAMIPLLKKLPQFFDLALTNFSKYENGGAVNPNYSNNAFNALAAITSPGVAMGYPQMMNPNPAMTPAMNMYQQPMNNPLVANQPVYNNGYQQPVQQQMQPQQQAPLNQTNLPDYQNSYTPGSVQQNNQQSAADTQRVATTKTFGA